MNIWAYPTSNLLINTFLRSLIVIALLILGFRSSWYTAYWGAVIHDALSLIAIKDMV